MAAKKLAISLDDALAERIRRAAERETAGNVSAWLADAAQQRLRHAAAEEALREYESAEGIISEEELAKVRAQWPRG